MELTKITQYCNLAPGTDYKIYRDNITKNVHSIIYWPFGLYGRYEGLKTCKQILNWISVQEITIPNIKMYIGWY